jgi:arylsulfatase A-like enzyme
VPPAWTLRSTHAAVVLTIGGLVACAPDDRHVGRIDGAPSVALITIDTQRADHTSAYGYDRQTTPHLDEIAGQGSLFSSAYTPTPTTGPSHASLFTSTYPAVHGVRKNGHALPASLPTLAQVLNDAGYQTAGIVGAFPLAERFGYGRGFDFYDDDFLAAEASILLNEWEGHRLPEPAYDRRASATTSRALRWLDAAATDAPFFLWVHYYDPHEPYEPPPRYRDLFATPVLSGPPWLSRAVAHYDAEIRYSDAQVGRLVRALDRTVGAAHSLVVIATDHGEGLMQHGLMAHGENLYEELVRVVLLFRWEGHVTAGRRFSTPVGLIDVAPTLLSLLGLSGAGRGFQGIDLSPALLDGIEPAADRPLYFQRRPYERTDAAETGPVGSMFGVRVGRWKYIEALEENRRELFDLSIDPQETRNLGESQPGEAARLAIRLRRWVAAAPSFPAQPVADDVAAGLRALGYVD